MSEDARTQDFAAALFLRRCGFAAISVSVATWLRLLLDPALGNQFPFETLLFAVLGTAWYGGLGPALVAVVLGAFSANYFIMPPRGSLSLASWDQQVGIFPYLSSSFGIALLGGLMHEARRRAEASGDIERRQSVFRDQAAELARTNAALETSVERLRVLNEESRQAEERFHRVVESAPNGMVMVGPDGRIVLVNAHTERLFGYHRDELLGKPVELLVPDHIRDKHPEYRASFMDNPQVRSIGVGRDLFGRRKDGSEFPVEIGLKPIKTAEGLFVLSAIADITERKRIEKSVRDSEERLHAFVENMTEGVVISSLDGHLLHWNRAALDMHGFASSEEWCRALADFVNFFELSTLDGQIVRLEEWPLSRLLRGERLSKYELRVRRLDTNRERIFSYGGNVVMDANGNQVVFLTVTDITQSKKAEDALLQIQRELEQRVLERTSELEAANKELEAFSYSVSHDLRAPLRAIDGFSRILMMEFAASLPQEAQEYLQDVRSNTLRMGHLVDDLLAFSRLSRQPIKKQPVAPANIVHQCLKELSGELDGRKVDIRVGDLPMCLADPALLKQVWINLLSNALKYTGKRESASIEIGCLAGDQTGTRNYFIKDNGVGFDMRYVHKLFGVFQRLHRAEDYAGTGVGLAIVQRILHRHGGRIWVEAEPDRGATFYFSLEESEGST